MPDLLVRGIDGAMAERIKALAREHNWTINDVILYLLKQSLGLGKAAAPDRTHQDIAVMAGTWDSFEAAAFRAAVDAFEQIPDEPEPYDMRTKPP